ncbi:helix-turn-helix transcriptional regulator [Sphingobium fluviale]|nr:AraC family transcriptional regulator [Sphingobium fluviale]
MCSMQWEGDASVVNAVIGSLGSRSQPFECSRWSTHAVKHGHKLARLSYCPAEHSAYVKSQMPAHELQSHGGIANAPPRYYLFKGDRPARILWRDASQTYLSPDEMILLSSEDSMTIAFHYEYESQVLIFDTGMLDALFPSYHKIIGKKLDFTPAMKRIAGHIFSAVSNAFEAGLFEVLGDGFCHSMLSILRHAEPSFADSGCNSLNEKLMNLRCGELKTFIERRVCDPELNLAMIADHFDLSRRYIQQIFASTGTTPTQFIEQVRLKFAAELIQKERDRSITDIAFSSGFNSSSYFSTRFRLRFGKTPRAYRHDRNGK